MNSSFRTLLSSAAFGFALVGCTGTMKPVMDAGEMNPDEVEYMGEAGGAIPDFTNGLIDAGNNGIIDAGEFVVDKTCCKLSFSISLGDEPSNAVGTLRGEAQPLSDGVPLMRVGDAGYTAAACFPINASTYYWYEFGWQTGDPDAGGVGLGDGGYWVTIERYSPTETNYPTGTGTNRNYIPAVSNCALLDAGTGP